MGHTFGYKSGQTGGSSPFHGRRPPLKQIYMIDKEYIKGIKCLWLIEDVYYLPPGACEEFYFATNPFDKDYIR